MQELFCLEALFSKYNSILQNDLKGNTVMNYVSSHDDSSPYDKKREKTFESGTKLLLTPGISQVYYGDESARPLDIPGTIGDATLRSMMNWEEIKTNMETQKVLNQTAKNDEINSGQENKIDLKNEIYPVWQGHEEY